MALRQRVTIIIVAAPDHRGHRNVTLTAAGKDTPVAIGDTLLGNMQAPQRIVLKDIHAGVIKNQIRLHQIQQLLQRLEHRIQIILIRHTQRQAHIQVAFHLAHRKIFLAMNGAGKSPGFIGQHGRGAIALMHIAIKHQYFFHHTPVQQLAHRKRLIIEDAETGTEIVMGVMGATGQMTGDTMLQCQLRCHQGAHGRNAGALHQRLTPRQPHAP